MSGLKGAPNNPTKIAERRSNLDNAINKMLAAKPATTTAAFNDRLAAIVALQARIDAEDAGVILPALDALQARIDAEDAGVILPALDALQARIDAEDAGVILPPLELAKASSADDESAAAAKREESPAHLRNRTRKQSAVLEQLMAKMRVEAEAEREVSANGFKDKTIYYNNTRNDRWPSLGFITGRYNIRLAQAARAKAAANLEGERKQKFYDRVFKRFQTPPMHWKTYEKEYGSSLYNKYKYTMGGALSKTMSAPRKSQKTRKTHKGHKAHKTHKTCRH